MRNLISLEIKHNSLKTYINAALIITVISIVFLYVLPFIPSLSPTEIMDSDMFSTYTGISTLNCMVSMACFAILSSVMYAKFIVEDYSGQRVILLFSYPVSRTKIFLSKVFLVFLFTVISMVVCGLISLGIFYLTESFFPLVDDTLTIQTILNSLVMIIVCSFMAGAFSSISLWFGLWKKSVPATIVSEIFVVIIAAQAVSASINATGTVNGIAIVGVAIFALVIAAIVLINLSHKIGTMEV